MAIKCSKRKEEAVTKVEDLKQKVVGVAGDGGRVCLFF